MDDGIARLGHAAGLDVFLGMTHTEGACVCWAIN